MSATVDPETKAKRHVRHYDIVLVPHGLSSKGKVIGTVEGSLTAPTVRLTKTILGSVKVNAENVARAVKSVSKLERTSGFRKLGNIPSDPEEKLAQEAKSLVDEVAKAMKKLADAQKSFRAELAAAYDEGEELLRQAAV